MHGHPHMDKETVKLNRTLVEKSVNHILETANVPGKHFLKIARVLRATLLEHQADRTSFREMISGVATHFKQHKEDRTNHLAQLEELKKQHADILESHKAELERVKEMKKGEPGEPGTPGDPGKDADHELIISTLVARDLLPKPEPGEPGKDAEFDEEALFKKFIALIQKNKLINATHVQGLQGWVKDGVKYRYDELMHGGGIASGSIFLPISGTINAANTAFVFKRKPALVNVNGTFYRETKGWSWTASTQTVTLDNPVGQNGDIYAI